jgi:hypothetical protein
MELAPGGREDQEQEQAMTGHPQFKAIEGCPCGSTHVLRQAEADRALELIEQTDPLEVTAANGSRVTVPPIAVVLHGDRSGELYGG